LKFELLCSCGVSVFAGIQSAVLSIGGPQGLPVYFAFSQVAETRSSSPNPFVGEKATSLKSRANHDNMITIQWRLVESNRWTAELYHWIKKDQKQVNVEKFMFAIFFEKKKKLGGKSYFRIESWGGGGWKNKRKEFVFISLFQNKLINVRHLNECPMAVTMKDTCLLGRDAV
jgi:hypothetical protein